jgi:hypothetical protein
MTHQWKIGGWRRLAALRASVLGLLIGALLCDPAVAQNVAQRASGNPDPTPILRIETGMHIAPTRIGTDDQCRLLATGSTDKTVRLWSMPDGKLLRTQRLPIGPGHGGKIVPIAVSPDGRLVAAGGWDAAWEVKGSHGVYVFDSATGTAMRRLGAFPNVMRSIAFSLDGKRLAVALESGYGIRVLDMASGRELMSDPNFGGKGLAFGADGSLFALADGGQLGRYGPDLKRSARVALAGGKLPISVAVDPAGQRLAVGFDDTTAVEIYDAVTLRRIALADTADATGALSNVAWSRDGNRIFAAGSARNQGDRLILSWTRDGRRVGSDVAVADNSILSLKPCGDAIAFSSSAAFGLLRPDGTAVTLGRGRTVDMRDKVGDAFAVSDDGKRIRFGLGVGAVRPVVFDLTRSLLVDAAMAPAALASPKIDGLRVTDWRDTTTPRLAGRPIPLEPHEVTESLAVQPDSAGFVLGSTFNLRAFDARGAARWNTDIPDTAWGVNLARGGELVLAAFADGTIRWYRWSDGKELLALFVDRESKAWVAWTPQGYYSASPGGEELIGWHVNRGWEQPADFFPAARFRDTYARPDIVERVLDTMDEAEAVRLANAARPGKTEPSRPIAEQLPPVVTILSPVTGSSIAGESTRLDYVVRSPSGLPVDAVESLVDGRPASAQRGFARVDDGTDALKRCLTETKGLGRLEGGLQGCRGSIEVRLPPGSSEVGLFARSGAMAGDVVKIRVMRAGAATADELLKPKLYALVVGISAYANADYNLAYAAKDARDFSAALVNQKDGLYSEVTLRTLPDKEATANAIRDGLDWLTKQVTSRDVGLVYLAGHGVLDERERFYFLAADSDMARLRATGVPREDIQDALNSLAGKALLFLDACHAGAVAGDTKTRGGVDINSVVNEFTRSERGVVVFTASTGKQLSQENSAWGNGAFTKAVIEGLGLPGKKAMADFRGDGKITTSALDYYVSERVKTLTGGTQSPIMIRPPTVPDYPIAIARQ